MFFLSLIFIACNDKETTSSTSSVQTAPVSPKFESGIQITPGNVGFNPKWEDTADDLDGDGYDSTEDCDDNDPDSHPGATEVCDEIDNNCDGQIDEGVLLSFYFDADADTFGDDNTTTESCTPPSGYVSTGGDCNDADDSVNPASSELCNNIDDNCNGIVDDNIAYTTFYKDTDLDGYGNDDASTKDCIAPSGYVTTGGDCDDLDATINPAAKEVCNDIDDDCNGQIDDNIPYQTYYFDADLDGYGDPDINVVDCMQPLGTTTDNNDCDDSNAGISPGATETCDGIDNDCNTHIDDGGVCPCSVESYGGQSYLFCQTVVTWNAAEQLCANESNYELVVINDAAEQAWIWSTTIAYNANYWWWLGLHNQNATPEQEPTGGWEWIDGTAIGYTNWYPIYPLVQPDNYNGIEDCAHIDPSHGYWNDLDCNTNNWYGTYLYYICESTTP